MFKLPMGRINFHLTHLTTFNSLCEVMCRGILPQKFLDRWCSINPYIVRLRGHFHGLGRHHIEDVGEMLNREGKMPLASISTRFPYMQHPYVLPVP